MDSKKITLWMGNFENWMNQTYLYNLMESVNVFSSDIILKNYPNKPGCVFLKFFSKEMAQNVLDKYYSKTIKSIKLQINQVHSLEQKFNYEKIIKFTVS